MERGRKRPDELIGEGYVFEDCGGVTIACPTQRLTDRRRVQHLLDFWNESEGSAWGIVDRPEDRIRDRPAADFLCRDERTRKTALIDVTEPSWTKDFLGSAARGELEICFSISRVVENFRRLLAHKDQQLAGEADRKCILLISGYVTDSKQYDLWIGCLQRIDLAGFPNIEELYVWSEHDWDPILQVHPT